LVLRPYSIRDRRDGLPFGEVIEEGEGDDGDQENASNGRDVHAWCHCCRSEDEGTPRRANETVFRKKSRKLRRQDGRMQVRSRRKSGPKVWFVLQKAAARRGVLLPASGSNPPGKTRSKSSKLERHRE
jgi:hypothetical protein